jgi:hypothetical protein
VTRTLPKYCKWIISRGKRFESAMNCSVWRTKNITWAASHSSVGMMMQHSADALHKPASISLRSLKRLKIHPVYQSCESFRSCIMIWFRSRSVVWCRYFVYWFIFIDFSWRLLDALLS